VSIARQLFESGLAHPKASYFLLSFYLSIRGVVPAAFMQHPGGLITRHIIVPRPSGAAHANRLSSRFVPPKAPVLGTVSWRNTVRA